MTDVKQAEVYLEVLGRPSPQARLAEHYVEVLAIPQKPVSRMAETYVEVLAVRPPDPVFIGWGTPI